jgi:uroporphyrinogen III methyltransferase / synthase
MGARVDERAVYRIRAATERASSLREALEQRAVDVVTFTSSSTVRNFAALWTSDELRSLMDGVTVACIGPITRATASALGLKTHVMPTEYTIPALARAIAAHFEEQRS